MKINNKEFLDWNKEDLKALIENDVFRENDSIDYKVNFAMLECTDKNLKRKNKQNSEMISVLLQIQMADISFLELVKFLEWLRICLGLQYQIQIVLSWIVEMNYKLFSQ